MTENGVTLLSDVRDLLVSADGIEATYGQNAYSDYLRKNRRYPSPNEAAAIGQMIGGRCRAIDGKLYPRRTGVAESPKSL